MMVMEAMQVQQAAFASTAPIMVQGAAFGFGEAGMHVRPTSAGARPIAAGLFGMASTDVSALLPRRPAGRA